MGMLPILAGLIAALNVIAMFAGLRPLEIPLFLLAALFALFGFLKPAETSSAAGASTAAVRQARSNGRTVSAFAVLIAALPFFRPIVQDMALRRAQAIRARETAASYTAFEAAVSNLTPQILAFYRQYGTIPSAEPNFALPVFRMDGVRLDLGPAAPIQPPVDPFDSRRSLSLHALGPYGALVVSVGQDGVAEYPPPRHTLTIDAQPNDPTALFAAAGVDLRLITYDPTNGSLSTGDLVAFIPSGDVKREDILGRLDKAWHSVNNLTPLTRTGKEPDFYAPEDDAKTAAACVTDAKWLAALAAASRAVHNRQPHPNFWKTPDVQRADYYRGMALFQLGHSRSAADCLLDYLAVFPNDPDAHYWAGIALLLGGDAAEARHHLAAAFELDPTHPRAAQAAAAYEEVRANRSPAIPPRAISSDSSLPRPPVPAPPAPVPAPR